MVTENIIEKKIKDKTKDPYKSQPPSKLYDYIYDSLEEGATITLTTHEDGYTWIIEPQLSTPWIVLVQWYHGDDFTVSNINGNLFDNLQKIINNK